MEAIIVFIKSCARFLVGAGVLGFTFYLVFVIGTNQLREKTANLKRLIFLTIGFAITYFLIEPIYNGLVLWWNLVSFS